MEKIFAHNLDDAAKLLQEGKIVAFPTETVYGLGIVFDNEDAFRHLVDVKKRSPHKPFTLMCSSVNDIAKYALISNQAQKIIDAFLPGELTIILESKANVPSWVHLGTGYIGIRVPKDDIVSELIKKVGRPLLVPSANRGEQRPLTIDKEVILEFQDEVDGIILGKSQGATPSTVISAYDKIILLREGNISLDQIMKVVGD